MQIRLMVAWLGNLTVLGAGCGDTSSEGAPVSKDQFLDQFAHALCDNVEACCTSEGFTFQPAGCLPVARQAFAEEFADDQLHFDENKAGECVRHVRDLASSCAPRNVHEQLCDGVF